MDEDGTARWAWLLWAGSARSGTLGGVISSRASSDEGGGGLLVWGVGWCWICSVVGVLGGTRREELTQVFGLARVIPHAARLFALTCLHASQDRFAAAAVARARAGGPVAAAVVDDAAGLVAARTGR
eukprot:5014512-Alexandrium_andersonii.AAC.1